VDGGGFDGTTGVGPDLYAAAQGAVRAMIDYLGDTYDLSREDAYVLSSLCVDSGPPRSSTPARTSSARYCRSASSVRGAR